MIKAFRTPEAVRTMLEFIPSREHDAVLRLLKDVNRWDVVNYPTVVDDEESEYIGKLFARAALALKTLAEYDSIYSGIAHISYTDVIIVDTGDMVSMMAILRKTGQVRYPLEYDVVTRLAMEQVFAQASGDKANELGLTIAAEAIECLIDPTKSPSSAAVNSQMQAWTYHRENLIELCTPGHYDYKLEPLDKSRLVVKVTPKFR